MRRRYAGVTAFTGMPGGGKTYGLAEVGARALSNGWPVWSNEGFNFRDSQLFGGFEDFLNIPGGCMNDERHREGYDGSRWVCEHGVMLRAGQSHPVVVLWDELPVYVSARKWQEFPDGLMYRLTQVRKDGLWFYYSAIHMDFVDKVVRQLTFWEWQCRSITGRVLYRQKFGHPELRKKDDKPRARELVVVKDRVAELYDTFAKVKVFEDKKTARKGSDRPKVQPVAAVVPATIHHSGVVLGKSEPRGVVSPGLIAPRDPGTEASCTG